MKGKFYPLMGVFITLFLIGGVFATTVEYEQANTPSDNLIGRLISTIQYTIFKTGSFTVYGRELGCSVYPDKKQVWTSTGTSQSQSSLFNLVQFLLSGKKMTVTAPKGTSGFVNWFRGGGTYTSVNNQHPDDTFQFMGEVFVEAGKSVSFTCDAGSYWDYKCYYEFYNCPPPCHLDTDCSSDGSKICDKSLISNEIPNAGVCKSTSQIETESSYQTKVYECSNGEKNYVKSVSSGDINFCKNSNENNYILPGGESTGVCYTLDDQPKICTEITKINVQKGISVEQLNYYTTKDLLKSICTSTDQCETGTCLTLKALSDKDLIETTKSKSLLEDNAKIFGTAVGALTSTAGCIAIITGAGIATGGVATVGLPLCALTGAVTGYGATAGIESIITSASGQDSSSYGYCITSGYNSFNLDSKFDLFGLKVTLSTILIVVGVFLLLIILK